MREIKFKAHIKSLGWIVDVERINFDVETIEIDLSNGQGDIVEFNFDEVELMQFTGQHDKNGKEIYEGHILQDKRKRKFKVTWNNDIGSWINKPLDENQLSYPCFNCGTVKGLEIVGHIFEDIKSGI